MAPSLRRYDVDGHGGVVHGGGEVGGGVFDGGMQGVEGMNRGKLNGLLRNDNFKINEKEKRKIISNFD